MPRGGTREGAGRKPASAEGRRIARNVRLSPEADALVRTAQQQRGGTYTEALEWLILRAPGISPPARRSQ